MNYFKRIFRYAKPFKKYIFLNIFFNALYALFSALSFLSLMPMLEVLFGENNKTYSKPEFNDIYSLGNNLEGWLNYQVSSYAGQDPQKALIFVISAIIILFFLKNFFNYLAMFFITFLRNGILTNLREDVYKKITSYANYDQMNGIEKSWFIECIANALMNESDTYNLVLLMEFDKWLSEKAGIYYDSIESKKIILKFLKSR